MKSWFAYVFTHFTYEKKAIKSNFPHRYLSAENSYIFPIFYGKVGVISCLLFHLIWKNYVLNWDFDSKSWIVDFFTRFTHEKTPQNNFSHQNFSVEIVIFYTVTRKVVCETSEKNPQINFSSQNLSLEHNFFKWDGKVTKIWWLLFHRIWKITTIPYILFEKKPHSIFIIYYFLF